MKNFGIGGQNNTPARNLGYDCSRWHVAELGRHRKLARKRVRPQTLFYFPLGPWICSALVEHGRAEHASILRVTIFLVRVRFTHRAKAESRDSVGALTKTFHNDLGARHDEVTAREQRCFAPIDNVETVHGKHDLQSQITFISNDNRITAALFADHKPPIAN